MAGCVSKASKRINRNYEVSLVKATTDGENSDKLVLARV